MERISQWLAWGMVGLVAIFSILNWSALTANTSLNLLVADVQAPMGVVLLGLTALFVVMFFVANLYTRITGLIETRALLKELRQAQAAADKAEASRLASLQQLVQSEFRSLNERINLLQSVRTAALPALGDRP